MLSKADLKRIARARLQDAEVLLTAGRCDGAVYLCGYAIEIALKARICHALRWTGYPSTNKEFEGYQTFRTHDLDTLLHMSGVELKIKTKHFAEWSVVAAWDPNVRYRPIGHAAPSDAVDMLKSAKIILAVL